MNIGNRVKKVERSSTTAYTYNAENKLIQITNSQSQVTSYKYDGLGRRIEKNINGTIIRYVYDGEDILLEYDGTNNLIARYTHGLGIDEPLIMERGGQSYYYHTDGLGSIVTLTDSGKNVVQTYIYSSFGQIVEQTGSLANPYTYTGREYDSESGLYFYRARYYDPKIGRFLQEDPIGFWGGINFYAYVWNNPVNFIDSLGLYSLTYDDIKALVATNNLSGQSDELIISLIWKESGFDPNAESSGSSARGLMQVTKGAAHDAGYSYDNLFDPATNIQAGSKYLNLRIQWAGGNVTNGLNGYGTGKGYATDILESEQGLKTDPDQYQKWLDNIHK